MLILIIYEFICLLSLHSWVFHEFIVLLSQYILIENFRSYYNNLVGELIELVTFRGIFSITSLT